MLRRARYIATESRPNKFPTGRKIPANVQKAKFCIIGLSTPVVKFDRPQSALCGSSNFPGFQSANGSNHCSRSLANAPGHRLSALSYRSRRSNRCQVQLQQTQQQQLSSKEERGQPIRRRHAASLTPSIERRSHRSLAESLISICLRPSPVVVGRRQPSQSNRRQRCRRGNVCGVAHSHTRSVQLTILSGNGRNGRCAEY